MHIPFSLRPVFSSPTDWIPASNYPAEPNHFPNESKFYSGRFLLREEIPLDDQTFQSFISEKLFTSVPAIEQKKHAAKCRRCGNEKKHLFGILPCARCGSRHLYCRSCIEMGRILACEPLYCWTGPFFSWPKIAEPCSWQGELSRFQKIASAEIAKTMREGNAEKLVWAVCGAGKTEMLFEGLTEAIRQGKRICLATPRADVVRELLPRFKEAFASVSIAGLYGGSEEKQLPAQLTISTTHQLLRFAHAFDVLIIDEIDAFPYHNDPTLHFAASRAAKPSAAKIYLTATPRKHHQKAITAGRLPAVFVPVRFHGQPLPVPQPEIIFRLKKDIQKSDLPQAVYHWIACRKNPSRQLLIFVPTVDLAGRLLPVLKENLPKKIPSIKNAVLDTVHAADPDREEKVRLFRNKQIDILITTTILERGVTFPSVDVAVLNAGHHVFDEAALVQIAGRAGRSFDDPTGEVMFYHDGKTEAITAAIRSIKEMNRKGQKQ